jgi:hypothetical protein
MSFLRRIRGALAIATLWGLAYATLSALMSTALWATTPEVRQYRDLGDLLHTVPRAGLEAAAAGAIFALILAVTERNRTVGTLSEDRVWRWGIVAGAASAAGIKYLEHVTAGVGPLSGGPEPLKDVLIYCVSFAIIGGTAAKTMVRFARGKTPATPAAAPLPL